MLNPWNEHFLHVLSPSTSPLVGILMGSDSDWPKIQAAAAALDEFGVRLRSARHQRPPHARTRPAIRHDGGCARAAR